MKCICQSKQLDVHNERQTQKSQRVKKKRKKEKPKSKFISQESNKQIGTNKEVKGILIMVRDTRSEKEMPIAT